jgi:hypothetical protein
MKNTHFEKHADGGSISRKYVNPDLVEERAKCNFDQIEMAKFIALPGHKEYYDSFVEDIRKNPEL